MVLAHAAAGSLLTKGFTKNSKLTSKQLSIVYGVGITASVLPDFDTIVLLFNNTLRHRHFITHSFVPYIVIGTLAFLYAVLQKNYFLRNVVGAFMLGVVVHLVIDLFYGGVAVFLPFNKNIYGYPINIDCENRFNWALSYFSSKLILGEFALIALFMINIKNIKNNVGKYLPIIFTIGAFIMLVAVTFL